ncbi:unnamed protein product [Urochloa humidicola]
MQLRSGRRLSPPRPQAPRGQRRHGPAPRRPEDEDRISSLHDDLLLAVLVRLGDARQAARTSVLARRWRGLWTQLPELILPSAPFRLLEASLAQIKRSNLDLLHIDLIPKYPKKASGAHVFSLLRSAERPAPDDVHLSQWGEVKEESVIELPCFVRTTSITLSMHPDLSLVPPTAGEFTKLKRLKLDVGTVDLGRLLPMCPSLSSLHYRKSPLCRVLGSLPCAFYRAHGKSVLHTAKRKTHGKKPLP